MAGGGGVSGGGGKITNGFCLIGGIWFRNGKGIRFISGSSVVLLFFLCELLFLICIEQDDCNYINKKFNKDK
jgi:hypothetical protein